MRIKKLNDAIDLTADSDEDFDLAADVAGNLSPFYGGATAILVIGATSDIDDVDITFQQRSDQQDESSAFETLTDVDGNDVVVDETAVYPQYFEIVLPQVLRVNVNEGTTGVGTASAVLLQN